MASQAKSAPKSGGNYKADLMVVAVLGAIWLVPWMLLSAAAKLAGGAPSYSPLDFISRKQFDNYRADHDQVVWWHLVGAHGAIHPVIFWGALILVGILLGLVITAVMSYASGGASGMSRLFVPRSLSRTSRWANRWDLRALRSRVARPGCLTVGRRGTSLIVTEPETSLLVVGPTRSGKTSGLIIPNLFEWDGPAIVTSTKAELVEVTGAYRQSVGPVYVYDPTGEISDMYQSVTWSPIGGCHELDYAWQVSSWLCAGLQQGGGKGDNDWAHWGESGKLLIAPLLFVAATTGRHSIVDVKNWILTSDLNTPMAILQDMLAEMEMPNGCDADRALGMLVSIDQRPDKERGTVFSTCTRIFNVFNETAVAQSALTSRFNADDFIKRKGTLYLCTPARTPERVASLFVGILMTVVTHGYVMSNKMPRGRLNPELGLFLDELANVVPIEELPSMASQGAGRGIILMSVVQDLSQLRNRYGNDKSNSILNNHGATVVLPGIRDPETTEQIAKMVGKSEYTDVSVQRADGKRNETHSVRSDQMASPDALRQLQDGTAIMIYRGKPPTIVRLRPWYRDRKFTELARRRFFRNADYVAYRKAS